MERQRKGKILIFGANGYIGRHVAKLLSEKGYCFIPAGSQSASIDGLDDYVQVDVRRPDSFEFLLKDAAYILLFSGMTGTLRGFTDFEGFITLNEIGLLHVLDGVRKQNVDAKIIFPSSRLVYKGQGGKPLREDDEKEFKTVYAMNKYACENYLEMYHNAFGIDYTVFRICVPYGTLTDKIGSFGTISHLVSKAEKGEDITIFGNGSQKRSLIHIGDLAEILIQAGLSAGTENDVFNISGPDILSIKEIAEQIATSYGVRVKSVPWREEYLRIESGDTIFDGSKLMQRIGYQYKYDFSSWVRGLRGQKG